MSANSIPAGEKKKIEVLGSTGLLIVTNESLMRTIKTLSKSLIVVTALCAFFAIVALWLFVTTREVRTEGYGITTDGRVYPLEKIQGEIFTPERITSWAGEKSKAAYAFSFRTISSGEWQNELSNFMTEKGKAAFIDALRRDGLLSDVTAKSAIVYAEFNAATRPLYMGMGITPEGLRVHTVEVDLIITIDARGTTKDRNRIINMPMALGIGEVGLGKAKDGLLIGNFKRAVKK